jgi:hypothetical protein
MLAAIKKSAAYIAVREWHKGLRRRAEMHRYVGTQYRCPICHASLCAFKPMWKSYWMHYQQYEYVYPPFAMETFNLGAFSCPS